MQRDKSAVIPAAPRMTLLQWIEHDNGDTTSFTRPACSIEEQTLHARIVLDPNGGTNEAHEPLQPPAGLRLPPLG
ncbi:hypothetical protein Sj15T_09740 [Sphingobium sp. TA15]|uniref:Uncharacterized protein n=1 Tax=Sphingobium indicum (strain DSM 16413 / CCM 7287 / MTCC 6362 / UT26 / NBRC 101211 / UT26S) TaxID=452662 RepID=D4Z237_SPHIU|nr:hypothetical protein [Sphingobium indicum]BAI96669.1 hypothetical protein SJA_C1-18350 [Sphingobium indicum UT26S]BDD65953.1 hypothetical protein Sj15T_09740 [Sphingobium sp. TA15]